MAPLGHRSHDRERASLLARGVSPHRRTAVRHRPRDRAASLGRGRTKGVLTLAVRTAFAGRCEASGVRWWHERIDDVYGDDDEAPADPGCKHEVSAPHSRRTRVSHGAPAG